MAQVNQIWEIKLLGSPQAFQGEKNARLQSRMSWCVLAALILPEALGKAPLGGAYTLSRQELANMFWADSLDPRHCLRQVISILKSAFGDERLYVDRSRIGILAGSLVSDVGRIRQLYEESRNAASSQNRIDLLTSADALIGGALLEGYIENIDSGFEWYSSAAAEVTTLLLKVLVDYRETQEAAGDLRGAFGSALRVLQLNPSNRAASERVWDLGRITDQTALISSHVGTEQYPFLPSHIANRARKGLPLSSRENRQFEAAFEIRRERLGVRTRNTLPTLALLTAPFSQELAMCACGASPTILNELAASGFVEQDATLYHFSDSVRVCAQKRTRPEMRRRVGDRLFEACYAYLVSWINIGKPPSGVFRSLPDALPYLSESVTWLVSQSPFRLQIDYLNLLRASGLLYLASPGIPWLTSLLGSGDHTQVQRYWTAECLGKLFAASGQYEQAADSYRIALELVPALENKQLVAATHANLAIAYHHAEVPDKALLHNSVSIDKYRDLGLLAGVAGGYHFRAEILMALGDYTAVLDCLDQAQNVYSRMEGAHLGLAECLYWTGEALIRLERGDEALDAMEQSLRLRLDGDDLTGAGHCLAAMGNLHGLQGRYGEARAHILHAMALHSGKLDEPSRVAALGNLGDVYLMEGQLEKARTAYVEGLEYWKSVGHVRWSQRFTDRLARIDILPNGDE